MPRSHDELIDETVRLSGEIFRLRGVLGDLIDALRAGEQTADLIERAESVIGRVQDER
ncbi:MAG: hypothetical protein AB1651_18320 [Pseudomonadota bacterium]